MSAVPSTERYCPTCEKSFRDAVHCPDDGTELVVLGGTSDPLLGRNLKERYTIKERLGAGGMGTVYKGLQHSVGREVAIKVVNPRLVNEAEATKRFLREAKLASRFNHPNAVSVLDFGQTEDGLFFLVMELLSGKTLDAALRETGRLPLDRLGAIGGQICDALEAAHKIHVVHRDLKPANVILLDGERDFIKVLDFGLAKSLSPDTTNVTMTNSGALLGTPAFMSPEASLGREADARADLYSLGVMLYVLASGSLPFNANNTQEMLAMQASQTPPRPPSVPSDVADVIMKLLEKEPENRYQTAGETRRALDAAIAFARKPNALGFGATAPQGVPEIPVELPPAAMASTIASSPTNDSIIEPSKKAPPQPIPATPSRAAGLDSLPPAARNPWARRFLYIAGAFALVVGAIVIAKSTHTPPSDPIIDEPGASQPAIAPDALVDEGRIRTQLNLPDDGKTPAATVIDAGVAAIDAGRDAGTKKRPSHGGSADEAPPF